MRAFSPHYGSNQIVVTGAVSASVTINRNCQAVRLVNSGGVTVYVKIGEGAQTATVNVDTPILAGAELILGKASGDNTMACVSAVAGALQVQTGEVVE